MFRQLKIFDLRVFEIFTVGEQKNFLFQHLRKILEPSETPFKDIMDEKVSYGLQPNQLLIG